MNFFSSVVSFPSQQRHASQPFCRTIKIYSYTPPPPLSKLNQQTFVISTLKGSAKAENKCAEKKGKGILGGGGGRMQRYGLPSVISSWKTKLKSCLLSAIWPQVIWLSSPTQPGITCTNAATSNQGQWQYPGLITYQDKINTFPRSMARCTINEFQRPNKVVLGQQKNIICIDIKCHYTQYQV